MGIATLIAENAGAIFKSVVEEFRLSPEQKAQYDTQLLQMQQTAEQADRDLDAKLNDIAGQNIRAETSSNDKFVRRARPFFLWVMSLGIGFNIFVPLVCKVFHYNIAPVDLTPYTGLFSAAFLGYTVARTAEKFKDKS